MLRPGGLLSSLRSRKATGPASGNDEARRPPWSMTGPAASPRQPNSTDRWTMESFFEKLAHSATRWTGSTTATVLAILVIAVWGIGGFFFGFDTDYLMYVNTGTTIV